MEENLGRAIDSFSMPGTWYKILSENTDKSESKEKWIQLDFKQFNKILTGKIVIDIEDTGFQYSAIWDPRHQRWITAEFTNPIALNAWYVYFAFQQPELPVIE